MARLLQGAQQTQVAAEFGVHKVTVNNIWSGKTWKHLFEELGV
jgi:DNA-binding XRE family transcriptional regulator